MKRFSLAAASLLLSSNCLAARFSPTYDLAISGGLSTATAFLGGTSASILQYAPSDLPPPYIIPVTAPPKGKLYKGAISGGEDLRPWAINIALGSNLLNRNGKHLGIELDGTYLVPGTELNYHQINGGSTINDPDIQDYKLNITIKQLSVTPMLRGTLDLSSKFSIIGKIGLAYQHTSTKIEADRTTNLSELEPKSYHRSLSTHAFDPSFAAELAFHITPHFSIACGDRYTAGSTPTSSHSDLFTDQLAFKPSRTNIAYLSLQLSTS